MCPMSIYSVLFKEAYITKSLLFSHSIATSNEDMTLEAVIGLLQKMPARQQGEVKKMLDSAEVAKPETDELEK